MAIIEMVKEASLAVFRAIITAIGCLLCGELLSVAVNELLMDVDLAAELLDPTVYLVKDKGIFNIFKKPYKVTVDPFTRQVKSYTGTKMPVNTKPYII